MSAILEHMHPTCPVCRRSFKPQRAAQRHCSMRCANTSRAEERWAKARGLQLAQFKPNDNRA